MWQHAAHASSELFGSVLSVVFDESEGAAVLLISTRQQAGGIGRIAVDLILHFGRGPLGLVTRPVQRGRDLRNAKLFLQPSKPAPAE